MFGGNVQYRNTWDDDRFEIVDKNGETHHWASDVYDNEWFPCANPEGYYSQDGSYCSDQDHPTDENVYTIGRFHFSRPDQVKPFCYPDPYGTPFDKTCLGEYITEYACKVGIRYNAGLLEVANRLITVRSSPSAEEIEWNRLDEEGNELDGPDH
jgi:hypothetical protein